MKHVYMALTFISLFFVIFALGRQEFISAGVCVVLMGFCAMMEARYAVKSSRKD